MNQEFYISVTPVRGDEYFVRTERMAQGVPLAEEIVTWQVDEWLEQSRQLMHDPLLGILRGRMRSLGQSVSGGDGLSPNLVELGQKLYNALFQGTIRDSWMTAQGIAQNRHEGLRLRLGLKGDRLPRLPWEVLHAGARPLATGTDVVFSRYEASFTPMATILQPHRSTRVVDPNQPLRILMVLAAPTDQEVLELQREANHLREELLRDSQSSGEAGGEIELTILNQPGREQLTQALEQGRYQILHYAVQRNLGMSGGDLYLVSDRTGLTEVLSGDDLAGLLVNNGIRMAVFNSCRGVYTATADPSSDLESGNLTEALLKRGIPAVLAMAERIPDDVALTLSRLFYRNLKQRYPIDLSLSRARQGLLSAYGSNQLYWALPILYLHPDFDGYLQPAFSSAPLNAVQEPPVEVVPPVVFGADAAVTTNHPGDLAEAEALFNDLEFDDPEDSDRQAVLDLLSELSREPEENPFSTAEITTKEQFFEERSTSDSLTATNEAELQSVQDCLALGQARYRAGDLTGAIVAYGRAVELDPNCAEAFEQMGIALEQLNSPTEAIVAYKMALQLEPNLPEAQQHLQRLEVAHNLQTFQPPDVEVPPPTQPAVVSVGARRSGRMFGNSSRFKPARRRSWVIAGIAGAAIAAGLGVWGFLTWRSTTTPGNLLPSLAELNQGDSGNANASDRNNLTALATRSFNQGDLPQGLDAVETLLDQGNIAAAEAAFESVPPGKLNNPAISFVRGRIAWQSLQQGRRKYSINDVQNYWRTALNDRKTAQYYTGLGFAYYAEGDFKRASDAWFNAVKLAKDEQKNSNSAAQGKANPAKQDEQTASAGIAMAAVKLAQGKPPNERDQLRREAVRLRNRLLRENPDAFQVNALARNWLWTESAIADWKALLAIK